MKKSDLQRVVNEVAAECGGSALFKLLGDTVFVTSEIYETRGGTEVARKRISKAKTVLKNRLLEAFPERKFYHAKSAKRATMWAAGYWSLGVFRKTDMACGIRIGLTDDERARYLAVGICFD